MDDLSMSRRRMSLLCLTYFLMILPQGTAAADDFPLPRNTEKASGRTDCRLATAAAGFRVPEGFHVSVFAAEPDVRNPIAMAWDSRGRLWVAENFTYAERAAAFRPPPARPRAHFRRHRRRRPFRPANGLHRPGADARQRRGRFRRCVAVVPAPAVVLAATAMATTFRTGRPKSFSMVFPSPPRTITRSPTASSGGPTAGCTAAAVRRRRARSAPSARPTSCGCRSAAASGGTTHVRKRFEALAHGTTNPWGHDWNALGELFFINTVNGHLWHMIPGAPFRSPAHGRPQPAGLRSDRPARRPLALGPFEGADPGRRRCRRQLARRRPRPQRRCRSTWPTSGPRPTVGSS